MVKGTVDLYFFSDGFQDFGVVVRILLVKDFECNLLSGLVCRKFDFG